MIQTVIGKKLGQTQGFLEDGRRIPLTRIDVSGLVVSQLKTEEKDGYNAVQLGFGVNKKADKPTLGHTKKAGLSTAPRFFRESKIDKIEDVELGSNIQIEEVLSAGDIIDVTGTSKGKGYAGVVKRHHFKGGPKTHGQSDRHRAPGSIGQSTTPGRVYKGKRMAGRMGAEQVTVKNLEVIEYVDGILTVKGLIPGPISSIVTITRRGVNKKHVALYKEPVAEEAVVEKVEEVGESIEKQEEQRVAADEQAKAEAASEDAQKESVEASEEATTPIEKELKTSEQVKKEEDTPNPVDDTQDTEEVSDKTTEEKEEK